MCGITRRLRMGAPRQALCAQGCHLVVFLNGTISTWCVCVMEDIDTVFSVILSSKAVVKKNVRYMTCPFSLRPVCTSRRSVVVVAAEPDDSTMQVRVQQHTGHSNKTLDCADASLARLRHLGPCKR